jgi:hypothetical protein
MNWKDIAGAVGKAAPLLGTLLGGPAGGAIGALVAKGLGTDNDPSAVASVLANPDAIVKLKQIEADQAVELQKLVVQSAQNDLTAETAQLQAINSTMQTEDKADHWPTYSWRPAIGFAVAFCLFASAIAVLVVFGAQVIGAKAAPQAAVQLPGVLSALAAVSATALPILGIASWYRGKMQADPAIKTDNRG